MRVKQTREYAEWQSQNTYVWVQDTGPSTPTRIVGTIEVENCIMQVGNGNMSHNGRLPVATVTEAYDKIDRFGNIERVEVGTRIGLEPRNNCGAASVYKHGGYATGWRARNRALPEGTPVTCTKCLKREQS